MLKKHISMKQKLSALSAEQIYNAINTHIHSSTIKILDLGLEKQKNSESNPKFPYYIINQLIKSHTF